MFFAIDFGDNLQKKVFTFFVFSAVEEIVCLPLD